MALTEQQQAEKANREASAQIMVHALGEKIRKEFTPEQRAGAIEVMKLIDANTALGYRNVCRPLKALLKELT